MYRIEKFLGETPLQALERLRTQEGITTDIPMTYAGRLDPMATGELIILVGDECKEKEYYMHRAKEYVFEILFGISTDSGDILGMPTITSSSRKESVLGVDSVDTVLKELVGKHMWEYPRYSSKMIDLHTPRAHECRKLSSTVQGKRHIREMDIKSAHCESTRTMHSQEVLAEILEKLSHAPPEGFRTDEIGKAWQNILFNNTSTYTIAQCSALVGSGTYIRTLCEQCAQRTGTVGCAYSIHRTRIFDDLHTIE